MMKKIITLALASIICTEAVYPVFPPIVLGVPNTNSRKAAKRQYLTGLGVAVNAQMTEVELDALEAALPVAVVAPVAQQMDHDGEADLIAQQPGRGTRFLNMMDECFKKGLGCACSSCSAIKDNPKTACYGLAALCCACAGLAYNLSMQIPEQENICNMCAKTGACCAIVASCCATYCLKNKKA